MRDRGSAGQSRRHLLRAASWLASAAALGVPGPADAQPAAFRSSSFPPPPLAPRIPYRHPDGREDHYAWLRDPAYPEITDGRVLAYLRAENAYVEQVMGGPQDMRPAMLAELRARVVEDEAPPPDWWHGRWYGWRYRKGLEYRIWYRKGAPAGADEEVIFDANREAAGSAFYAVRTLAISPDHRWMAVLEDRDGSERLRLKVRDLTDGRDVASFDTACSEGLVWSADSSTVFYIRQDESQRARWLHRYRIGSTEAHPLVYEEKDAQYFLSIDRSASGRFLEIHCEARNSTEQLLLELAEPASAPRSIVPRRAGHEYYAEHRGDRLLIRTNDRHFNFRLVVAPLGDPAEGNWQERIAGNDAASIDDIGVARDFWWIVQRGSGLRQVRVFEGETDQPGEGGPVAFPEPVYAVEVPYDSHWERASLRLEYDSLARPRTWYDYRVAERRLETLQALKVPSHDAAEYVVERQWARAPDGTEVPISLVRHQSTPARGAAPLVLYGYGAYGLSTDPGFDAERLPLVRRGVTYAIAHIRGGQELGRAWYDRGKLLAKRNTFDDFIACTEHLIANGTTAKGRVAAYGESAGGMLMGVVANQRPGLYGAIAARVPFVDVLSTMLDSALPLTPPEYVEWGNPAEKPFYDYIRSYSPYDNVRTQAYPAMFVTAGLNDSRVTYWEPAKWVARLRELGIGDAVLLLETEMVAGHGGASGRYKSLEEVSRLIVFLVRALDLPREALP